MALTTSGNWQVSLVNHAATGSLAYSSLPGPDAWSTGIVLVFRPQAKEPSSASQWTWLDPNGTQHLRPTEASLTTWKELEVIYITGQDSDSEDDQYTWQEGTGEAWSRIGGRQSSSPRWKSSRGSQNIFTPSCELRVYSNQPELTIVGTVQRQTKVVLVSSILFLLCFNNIFYNEFTRKLSLS